jgi:signal transduction histidine kinase
VVAEFRRSVFSLRNEAAGDRTLGERVAALAEHIRDRQGVLIEVHLDEGRARLRPEVETELQRIAQEGLNNAAKHAKASLIRVSVDVAAPHARVRVEDDGVGLQRGRSDSHGVRIMRERAARIGADLQLVDTGRGTLLDVTLGSPASAGATPPPLEGSTSS